MIAKLRLCGAHSVAWLGIRLSGLFLAATFLCYLYQFSVTSNKLVVWISHDGHTTSPSNSSCSLELFQRYSKINNYFVQEGDWEVKLESDNKTSLPSKFVPRMCSFGCAFDDEQCVSSAA